MQVRGRSNFSTVGEWSEPELLTFTRVPPPTNVQTTGAIRDVVRTQSGSNLRISGLRVPLRWTPPSAPDTIDGYQVVISSEPISGRYTAPSGDFVFNSGVSAIAQDSNYYFIMGDFCGHVVTNFDVLQL